MRSSECGVRNAECGVRNAECGVRNAECGMSGAAHGIYNVWKRSFPYNYALRIKHYAL